jgi:tRNA/tmRNA/rRNA uracil-C5-methylase (TrmA/RlmC/RlmD family)
MGRIKIVMMTILQKLIYRFNEISIKIPMSFFQRNRKINPKIPMEAQKTLNSQSISEGKKHTGVITVSDFKLHNKAIVTYTPW